MAVSRQTSRRSRFTLILLVLTSVTLLTLDLRNFEPVEDARRVALDAFSPVKDVADGAFEPVGDAWNGAFGYDELKSENDELRERIDELTGELALSADAKETLVDLYAELDIDYIGDVEAVTSTVVYGPVNNFDHTIEIDKGSDDGIAEGMPVVSSAGLVGTVGTVIDGDRSVVTLMTDPAFRVGMRMVESDEFGVARGQGRGRPLIGFTGIGAELDIAKGEDVITSGLERTLFPAHIPIGKVSSTVKTTGDLDQDVFIEPNADLENLKFVNVLRWQPEEGSP